MELFRKQILKLFINTNLNPYFLIMQLNIRTRWSSLKV